jgi:hypothetical protein
MRNQALPPPAADPGLPGQIGQVQPGAAAGQLVPAGQDGLEGVVEQVSAAQHHAGDLGEHRVFIDHREVEFAVGQPRQQPLHVIIHDRQRLLAAQAGQGRGHERGQRGGGSGRTAGGRAVTSTDTPVQIDTDKLMAFVFRAIEEVGATLNCALVAMGGQPGYYRDLSSHGPATAAGLAARTQTGEPYAREWLNAQAAGGFVGYDAQARRRAHRRNQPGVPARPVPDRARHRPGRTADHPSPAPRRGAGMAPAQPRCPPRMRAVLPARYTTSLITSWLPALGGVAGKLQRGAKVADVGYGHGASTVLMA